MEKRAKGMLTAPPLRKKNHAEDKYVDTFVKTPTNRVRTGAKTVKSVAEFDATC
jgi:hypothetical protein